MEIGSKVKHVNTGNKIHTITSIHGGIVATCTTDESMWHKLTKDSLSSPIMDQMVCKMSNLILA